MYCVMFHCSCSIAPYQEPKREPSDYGEASPQKKAKRDEVKKEKKYVEDEDEEEQHSDGEDWQVGEGRFLYRVRWGNSDQKSRFFYYFCNYFFR